MLNQKGINNMGIYQDTNYFSSSREYLLTLVRLLNGDDSILDVGCGKSSPLRYVKRDKMTGVDAFEKDIQESKGHGIHSEYVTMDVKKLNEYFKPKQFDTCVCLDVIEHLTKSEGYKLIKDMEEIARHRVIISTPNGYLHQESVEYGDFQEHKSGWSPDDMHNFGYSVIGLAGWKYLRKECHVLKCKPIPLWAMISWLTQQIWCRRHPKSAAQLLCWKDV